MSWEFYADVECPHCDAFQEACVEFDPDSLDRHGGPSYLAEAQCINFECDKIFWFKAYLTFEIEAEEIFKKKPKEKKP